MPFVLGLLRIFVRLASLLVPGEMRTAWIEEWNGELWHEAAQKGTIATVLGLLIQGMTGVVSDARAVRRSHKPHPSVRTGRFSSPTERVLTTTRELRHAVRGLRRTHGFTLVALVTLGLGIGANTAIFSVVNAVLLQPLPYPAADHLVALGHRAPGLGSVDRWGISQANYFYYRSEIESFADLGVFSEWELAFAGPGEPERLTVVAATSTLFTTLGARAAVGTWFTSVHDALDGPAVAVLSHEVWTQQFGSDPGVIGSTIRLNGSPREVLGVAAPGLHLPDRKVDVWIPLRLDPTATPNNSHYLGSIARLEEAVTLGEARLELGRHVERFPETLPTAYDESFMRNARFVADIVSLQDDVVGDVSSALWIILGSVSLVLLIACANVANLLLVRVESRRREIALREALGATRGDLARFLLAESLVLALAGGALGVLLAGGGVRGLMATVPESLPRLDTVTIDGTTLMFALAVSLITGMVFGVLPLFRRGSGAAFESLKTGARGTVGVSGRHGVRNLLVVGQVTMAFMLLVAAGIMWRSFHGLREVDPGFEPAGALVFDIALPGFQYQDHAAVYGFYRELITRLEQLPGVEHAGGVTVMPLEEGARCFSFSVRDRETSGGAAPCVPLRFVAPGYFAAMGIPMLAGRGFELRDNDQQNGSVVVSQVLAHQLWPGEDPIGKRVRIFGARDPWYQIVGVAGPVRANGLEEPPVETAYFPLVPLAGAPRWSPLRNLSMVIRTNSANTVGLASAVRAIVSEIAVDVPVANIRTLRHVYDRAMANTVLAMVLIAIAATLALLIGAVGIYGVIAYVVSERINEVGIRIALGAMPQTVSRMVFVESMRVVGLGVLVGLVGAAALQPVMSAVFFGVSGFDPAMLALAVVGLLAVASVASYLPARRAARVDPMVALRTE